MNGGMKNGGGGGNGGKFVEDEAVAPDVLVVDVLADPLEVVDVVVGGAITAGGN